MQTDDNNDILKTLVSRFTVHCDIGIAIPQFDNNKK